MRLLDLFCGAGGAAMGYYQAGFTDIVGVDIAPQPNYPFNFVQGDALEWDDFAGFDLIHASPPCQAFTVYGNNKNHVKQDHPNLIPPTRELLGSQPVDFVIENVPGAPLIDPIQLCGTSFPPLEVRRHRIFEVSFHVVPPPCNHGRLTERKYPGSSNRPNGRTVCNIGEWRVPLEAQQKAIGISWMTVPELSQSIPPAYTKFIGEQFLALRTDRTRSPSVNEIANRVRDNMVPTATLVDVSRALNDLNDANKITCEKVEFWGWRINEWEGQ